MKYKTMYIIFIIISLFLITMLFFNFNNKNKNKNKIYIFSYGSLTNYYIQKTLLKKINHLPPKATLLKESGYKRMWVEGKDDGISLNIIQNNDPKDINGIILELDESDFIKFDNYEVAENKHTRKKINWDYINTSNKDYYLNNDIYIYHIENTPKKADITKKMPNLYAMTVMEGFNRYGEDYLNLFLSLTE
jgi:hypothetical protein